MLGIDGDTFFLDAVGAGVGMVGLQEIKTLLTPSVIKFIVFNTYTHAFDLHIFHIFPIRVVSATP
jgi:NADH:ubiquinone oxidoreductase subunit K